MLYIYLAAVINLSLLLSGVIRKGSVYRAKKKIGVSIGYVYGISAKGILELGNNFYAWWRGGIYKKE